jgi:hypothetical protein
VCKRGEEAKGIGLVIPCPPTVTLCDEICPCSCLLFPHVLIGGGRSLEADENDARVARTRADFGELEGFAKPASEISVGNLNMSLGALWGSRHARSA